MKEEKVVKTITKMKKTEIQHIAALVSGILSILFSAIWYLGVIHGITAIVCGARTNSRHKSKMGKTGLILGIIGTSFSIISLLINFIILILYLF